MELCFYLEFFSFWSIVIVADDSQLTQKSKRTPFTTLQAAPTDRKKKMHKQENNTFFRAQVQGLRHSVAAHHMHESMSECMYVCT